MRDIGTSTSLPVAPAVPIPMTRSSDIDLLPNLSGGGAAAAGGAPSDFELEWSVQEIM